MNTPKTSSSQALNILNKHFGYESFRGHQQAIIENVIQGQDALVLMPTGGGKSLCYQIPSLLRVGVGIVISPLIALMEDQVNALKQLGIPAAFLNSSLSYYEQQEIESLLRQGHIQLLYIAPERLKQPQTLQLFQQIHIALFAIDEAHCVSQWGHDFRSDYLELNALHHNFPQVPRIALTATADERTRSEIIERLELHQAQHYISGFDRPNIQYRILQKHNARQQLLTFIRREHNQDAGIVYCLSRKKVESTATWLSERGLNALPYHAGLSPSTRQLHQQRFLREDGIIIVATIAFGMGIDKPDVRFVAHLDLPKSIEAYYQETGRAGRDGEKATAWMAYGLEDVIKLRQMMQNSQANEQHKRIEQHKLNAMLGLCEITSCRRQALLVYFDEKPPEQCGNCDSCLTPSETWNGTVAAQKALSNVYRTGQRFGANHLIDVLRGANNDKIHQFRHQDVSTYGIGKELSSDQWRSVYRQLVARGFLNVDMAGYGSLTLNEQSRSLLKGESEIFLRKDLSTEGKKLTQKNQHTIADSDKDLWQALRQCRKQLAEEFSVPPYVIFHDSTLMEMLRLQPTTKAAMLQISGVGENKVKRFGPAFIEIFENYYNERNIGQNSTKKNEQTVFHWFKSGMGIKAMAEKLQVNEFRIYSILSELIESGLIPLDKVVNIKKDQLKRIENSLLSMGDLEAEPFNYRPCKELLEEDINSGILCCIRASLLGVNQIQSE